MSARHQFHPKLSIVTPCYNSETYVREAIKSVLAQKYDNYEHIVADGGSTDGTLEILEEYSHLKVISEPDEGMYDALNKAISRASGDYVGWLNADDMYAPDAFGTFVQAARERNVDLIAGRCEIFEEIDGEERVKERCSFTPASKLTRGEITHDGVYINGCLLSMDLLDRLGEFDESLAVSGDREYLIRIAASEPTVAETTDVVYRYRHHDESLTFNDRDTFDSVKGMNLRDAREFMREYMNEPEFPKPVVEYCRRGFRARSGALLVGHLKRLHVRRALSITVDTLRTDPLWSVWMVSKTLEKTKARLS